MMTECRRYIGGDFLSAFRVRCEEILGKTDTWSLKVSDQDPNSVEFRYPAASTKRLDYVAPQVVLELGTHAEFVPHGDFPIRSFVAEEFPNVITEGDITVVALLAKRTFLGESDHPSCGISPAEGQGHASQVFASLL
jgi:hypothetical protein